MRLLPNDRSKKQSTFIPLMTTFFRLSNLARLLLRLLCLFLQFGHPRLHVQTGS